MKKEEKEKEKEAENTKKKHMVYIAPTHNLKFSMQSYT
jgi:hypothetical protein